MQFQQAQCAVNPGTLYCKAISASQVDLYKTVEGHACGQVSVSGDYEKYVEEFAGFSQGTCASQGYNHADGSKTISVPIVGDVSVAMYDNVLDADEMVTLYELAYNLCGETVLAKKYEPYAEKFATLKEGNCADQGFTVADGEKDIKVPFIGDIKIELFAKTEAQRTADKEVTLYQITGSECGQSTLPKKYESYAQKFDSELKEGTCAEQGYTVPDGAKDIHVPFIGTIHTAEFKKSALGASSIALYQVEFGVCAEVDVPNKWEAGLVEKFDKKLTEGTCASAGYTKDDGSKDVKIPVIGDVKFSLYTKAKNNLQMMI